MKTKYLPLFAILTSAGFSSLSQAQPANDSFDAPSVLPSQKSFQVSYNPQGSTAEPGEVTDSNGAQTVWFRWTAPETGIATFEASGKRNPAFGPMPVVIRVGQGSQVADMPWAGVSRQLNGGLTRLRVPVRAGAEYRIQVQNDNDFDPSQVNFKLANFAPITQADFAVQADVPYFYVTPNANDNFADAFPVRIQSSGVHPDRFSATASIWNSTFEPGEEGSDRLGTLWFRWVAPATGIATFRATGRTQRDDASLQPGIRIGQGTEISNLRLAATSRSVASLSEVQMPVQKGTVYLIQVQDAQDWNPGQTITLNLTGIAPITQPSFAVQQGVPYFYVAPGSNDNLREAFRLATRGTGGKFAYPARLSATATALEATAEAGELVQDSPSNTLWYNWIAPRTGIATFEAVALSRNFGSRLPNTQVRLWRGNTFDQMHPCAFSARVNDVARLRLPVLQGQLYRIQVDALVYGNDAVQNTTLNLRGIEPITQRSFSVQDKVPYFYVPAGSNDNFAAAADLATRNPKRYPQSFSATAAMIDAATEPGEIVERSNASRTVWFRWTAPVTGIATFDATTLSAAGERLVPVMRVGTGGTVQNARFINLQTSKLNGRVVASLRVVKGTTYRIQLDSGWDAVAAQTATLNLRGIRPR